MATVGVTGEGVGVNILGEEGSDCLAFCLGSATLTAALRPPMEPPQPPSPPSAVTQQPTGVGW